MSGVGFSLGSDNLNGIRSFWDWTTISKMRSFLGSNHIWEVVIFGNGQYLGSGPCWGQTIYRIRSFLGLESVWDLVILGSVYISMICLFLGTAVSGIKNYFWEQAMSEQATSRIILHIQYCFMSFLGLGFTVYIRSGWLLWSCYVGDQFIFRIRLYSISALSKMRSLLASGYICDLSTAGIRSLLGSSHSL